MKIKTLFLDIGGVLLTNGWSRIERDRAIEHFDLDKEEVFEKHSVFFNVFEIGKMTLDEYLDEVIFYKKRDFTTNEFKDFIFTQSMELPGSLDLFSKIKQSTGVRVFALSNEGKEINEYRIRKFHLDTLFDGFISSSYVHLRKPDPKIYCLACDIAFTSPSESLFVDDRIENLKMATKVGMNTLQFKNLDYVRDEIKKYEFIK